MIYHSFFDKEHKEFIIPVCNFTKKGRQGNHYYHLYYSSIDSKGWEHKGILASGNDLEKIVTYQKQNVNSGFFDTMWIERHENGVVTAFCVERATVARKDI